MQGFQFQSLFTSLSSHMPCKIAKTYKKREIKVSFKKIEILHVEHLIGSVCLFFPCSTFLNSRVFNKMRGRVNICFGELIFSNSFPKHPVYVHTIKPLLLFKNMLEILCSLVPFAATLMNLDYHTEWSKSEKKKTNTMWYYLYV